MTIRSTKKPPNANKDSSTNQQQQSQQQLSISARVRSTCDSEQSDEGNMNDDTIDADHMGSSSPSSAVICGPTGTDNRNPIMTTTTTTSSALFYNSKRKSHNNQKHHNNAQQIINQQARQKCTSAEENENDQYNSEDEYESEGTKYDRKNIDEREERFSRTLKEKKGLIIKLVQEDGACLFRAIADQVYGDEDMHSAVRQNCMDYIVKNADYFRAYITEDFDRYVERKRRGNCHGNHIEIIALSELYNRPIEIYEYGLEPINIVHGVYKTDNEPIRLSYHRGVHYNSIVDPWRPTAGLGLGLPNLEPGRAQESLIHAAIRQSEESHVEQSMLDDKLAATDWEATQDEIIQQISKESYLQWLYERNKQMGDNKTASTSDSSSAVTSDKSSNNIESNTSNSSLPLRLDERKDCEFSLPFHYENDPSLNFDHGNDDESLMQQVLAMSQMEYFEQLKQQQNPAKSNDDENLSVSDTKIS